MTPISRFFWMVTVNITAMMENAETIMMNDNENSKATSEKTEAERIEVIMNFDELDDSIDPFKPRGGIGSLPGNDVSNPFKARTKLGSSPPKQTRPIPITKKSKKNNLILKKNVTLLFQLMVLVDFVSRHFGNEIWPVW